MNNASANSSLTVSPYLFPIRWSFGQNKGQHQILKWRDIENGSSIHWFPAWLSIITTSWRLVPFNKQKNRISVCPFSIWVAKKYVYTVHIMITITVTKISYKTFQSYQCRYLFHTTWKCAYLECWCDTVAKWLKHSPFNAKSTGSSLPHRLFCREFEQVLHSLLLNNNNFQSQS